MKNDRKINDNQILILEADGKVDKKHGFGFLIQKRLQEFNIKSSKINLPKFASKLETLPKKPMIISGGMTEVTSDVDWIIQSKKFIKKIIVNNQKSSFEKKIPLFGICFGAQLIAESYMKGSVTFLDDPEIGTTKVIIEKQHPLFFGYNDDFLGYTFHYNQILPKKEFDILSTTKHKGHHFIQVFEVPNSLCFGVQFHPEFLFEEFLTLMKTYKQLIIELGLDYQDIIKNNTKEIDSNAKFLLNFVKHVLD